MASNSSVRLANMFPISFNTSAGSALCWRADGAPPMLADCWRAGVGDGWGGRPAVLAVPPRGGFGEENSVWRAAAPPARVLIVPAFSLANGNESDSVLELDWNRYNEDLVIGLIRLDTQWVCQSLKSFFSLMVINNKK